MKLRGFFFLLLVSVFPPSLFSNTLYFPQVAFGGGYSTTFVILNTGTTNVSAPLTFYSQSGGERADLSTQINVGAGSSVRFTLPNTGPLSVAWGEFAAGAGTVQGVATFDLRDGNGVLTTSAGVLGVEGRDSFLLPVDVTPSGQTGVAIGNASGSSIAVGLRLIGEDGAQVAVSTDVRFNPLTSRGQVADFVTSLFPQLAGTTFKGTLIIEAPPGSPANALAATALTVKEGLLSALPVIAGGTAGASTLDFPQVAFGGGYSTTFTIMNAGSSPVASQLNFYSQSGVARNDLSTTISIAGGGSARYTIPNQGPLTVVWGELVAGTGTVQGVATFDLRAANGTLTTSAGVLGIQPGSGYILPVDVTANGSTGIAISNPTNAGLNLGLRLFGEDGTLAATASDPRFTALASRGQFADFVTNVFPQLAGTTFKGTLAINAGSGVPASTLAATALTIKEGLLSALPVIPGTIAGPPVAADCLNTAIYSSANNIHLDYAVTGAQTGTLINDVVTTPNFTFEGQTATEFRVTQMTAYTGSTPTTSTGKNYSKLDGVDLVTYGRSLDVTSPIVGNLKSVYSPPARDRRYALGVGESSTQTYNSTNTFTATGSPPVVQTATTTDTVKYLGRETVTVGAGTFDTCKFDTGSGTTITWTAAGRGVAVKTSTVSSGSTTVQSLRSGTINGTAIRP